MCPVGQSQVKINQPMDQGVISWLKKYKYTLIDRLLKIYDDSNLLQEAIGTRRRGGYDGLEQGCKPNIYDVIQLTNKIWD